MSDETPTLEAGMKSPGFTAIDSEGKSWNLDTLNSDGKTVILYFYPKDDTPGCTKQACDFRDDMARLQSEGYVVFGVSKDSGASHDKFIGKYELNFPLLLDEDLSLHHSFGAWREKKNYGRTYMGTSRSTFVINPEGELVFARYNVKASGHVAMLTKELGLD